jgi:hypothetical protein
MKRLAIVLFAAWSLHAQQRISGIVEDASGAPIAKARLTLKSLPEGDTVTALSGPDGAFRFDGVADGKYRLEAQSKSLAAAEREVVVGHAPVELKLSLSVAIQSEEVTVTAASGKVAEEAITPDRNADRLNFEDEALDALPAPGNNPLAVVSAFLSPAAEGPEGVSVTVDGVESGAGAIPASAIRRIRINRNPYSVQSRRPGKARVEVLTEEGSLRRYRGGFGLALRNSVFDARNAFALVRPPLNRTVLDFNFSAPIGRGRSSFYVTGEGYRNNETAVVNARTANGPFVANVFTPERRSRFLGRLENKGEIHQTVGTYSFSEQSEQNRGVGGLKLPEQGFPTSEGSHRVQFSDRALLFNKLLNDFRVSATREGLDRGALVTQPSVEVYGAFIGGPNQTYRSRRETSVRIQDVATVAKGRHTLRFGVEAHPGFFSSIERQNFAGTYEFSDLVAFAAGRPLFYRITTGDPAVSLQQHETFAFVQDEVIVARGLNASYGVRYTRQSDIRDNNNLAPRAGIAFSPDGKTVIRGGAGLFHGRVTEDVQRRAMLFDGARLIESIHFNPAYLLGTGGPAFQPLPSIVRSSVQAVPVVTQASVSAERELWDRTTLAVEYQHLRGRHLLRTRNVNAPVFGLRPDAALLNINQVESSGAMRSNALTATVRGAWKNWLTTTAQYTFSRTEDDTGDPFDSPADPYDLRSEWSRSDYDQRHRMVLTGMITPSDGFRFGLFVTAASGTPFNITTGRDDNGDGIVTDRPAGVPRNAGFGPGLTRVDLRVTRRFRTPRILDRGRQHTSRNLELNIDVFNVLNHANFADYVGVLTSPLYGRASVALAPRTLQLSVRFKL